jgi:hypothetical protein
LYCSTDLGLGREEGTSPHKSKEDIIHGPSSVE